MLRAVVCSDERRNLGDLHADEVGCVHRILVEGVETVGLAVGLELLKQLLAALALEHLAPALPGLHVRPLARGNNGIVFGLYNVTRKAAGHGVHVGQERVGLVQHDRNVGHGLHIGDAAAEVHVRVDVKVLLDLLLGPLGGHVVVLSAHDRNLTRKVRVRQTHVECGLHHELAILDRRQADEDVVSRQKVGIEKVHEDDGRLGLYNLGAVLLELAGALEQHAHRDVIVLELALKLLPCRILHAQQVVALVTEGAIINARGNLTIGLGERARLEEKLGAVSIGDALALWERECRARVSLRVGAVAATAHAAVDGDLDLDGDVDVVTGSHPRL